jgi:hypothetical protein
MHTRAIAAVLTLCLVAFGGLGCKGVRPTAQVGAAQLSVAASQVLSWLPANTETLLTAQGPFTLPNSQMDYTDRKTQAQDLRQAFPWSPPPRIESSCPLVVSRGPNELGEMPYEGCAIVIFADDLGAIPETFMKDAGKNALRIDDIESHKVAVFQEKMEQDIWTMFVVFPMKNIVIVATNRDYLSDVLTRMRAPGMTRAFPETLTEWKYVYTQAEFWGMRHFDRSQSQLDPTSPLVGGSPQIYPTKRRSV